MALGNGDFIFVDDFDVIMVILEEDENVEWMEWFDIVIMFVLYI